MRFIYPGDLPGMRRCEGHPRGKPCVMTLQPDPDPENRTLVEREGVNAGSDRSTNEGDHDMVSPHVAPQQVMSEYDDTAGRPASAEGENRSGRVAPDGHAIGAPATVVDGGPPRELDETGEVLAPETDAVESGQDNGSMS
jgi:hypothetical protein